MIRAGLTGPRFFICASLVAIALGLMALMLATFLRFDNYALEPVFDIGFSSFTASLKSTLIRSIIVAMIAGAFAFVTVEYALHGSLTWIKGIALVVLYSADPVLRARSFRSAEIQLTGLLSSAGAPDLVSIWAVYAVPAAALAIAYAPLYAGLRVWDAVAHKDTGFMHRRRFLFTVLPPAFRRAPLALSLLFLFCLFDTWIAPVTSGRRFDYWGAVALRRALERDVDGALFMSLTGFLIVVLFAVAAFGLRLVWDLLFPRLRPIPHTRSDSPTSRRLLFWVMVLLVGIWPFCWLSLIATVEESSVAFSVGIVLLDTAIIATLVVTLTFVGALLILLSFFNGSRFLRGLISGSSWIVVLAPELVFVIGATYFSASGAVEPGMVWAVVVFSSFSAAFVFLAIRNFLEVSGSQHIPLLSNLAARSNLVPIRVLLLGYRKELALAGLLVLWIVMENVMLFRSTLGSSYTTAAVTFYDVAARSIDLREARLALWEAVFKAFVFGGVLIGLAMGGSDDT